MASNLGEIDWKYINEAWDKARHGKTIDPLVIGYLVGLIVRLDKELTQHMKGTYES